MNPSLAHTLALTTLILPLAHGAAFQLAERSASGMGRAYSGEAAIADDASILGSNPAGMSLLDDGMSFAFGTTIVLPSADVSGTSPDFLGSSVGIKSRDIVSDAIVPYGYIVNKFNDKFSAGIGVYSTHGLKTDYSGEFANRAGTNFSEIITININPAVSYRLNNQWTIGAGFDALYADGNLTSNIVNRPGNAPIPGTDIVGDDWGYGYNLGVLFELNEATRFGLHYRSSITLGIEGSVTFETPIGSNKFDAFLPVQLPDTLEFSAFHQLNDKWAIHGDILWTKWSKFKELDVQSSPIDVPTIVENWDDSVRLSIGATYNYSNDLTLRAGIAYDESPVSTQYRTLRIPDADRVWLSFGATYAINDCYNLDFAYTHIFADDVNIDANEPLFSGEAEGDVDLISLGVSGTF